MSYEEGEQIDIIATNKSVYGYLSVHGGFEGESFWGSCSINTKAKITFIKKQSTTPYYDSSAITGLAPKLYFRVEKKTVPIFN